MATKPTAPTVADPPLRSLGEASFLARTEAWFTWGSGEGWDYFVDSVDYISETNADVQAAAVAASLFDLSLSGLGGYVVGVNDGEDGFEAVEITEYNVSPFMITLLDDTDAGAARGTLGLGTFAEKNTVDYARSQGAWNAGTSTTESTISPAKLSEAVADQVGSVIVGEAIAAIGHEDVGSIGSFYFTGGSINAGDTTAASNLRWGSVSSGGSDAGPAPSSGTWEALSYHNDGTDRIGNFKRVL